MLAQDPTIGVFHWHDVLKPRQFGGLSVRQRNDKLRALAQVVRHYPMWVIRTSMDLVGFKETVQFAPGIQSPFDEPYFWLFQAVIYRIGFQLALTHSTEKFEIVFDEHSILRPKVLPFYDAFVDVARRVEEYQARKGGQPPKAAAILPVQPVFRTDDKFMPLQAADFLAGLMRREMLHGKGEDFAWLRPHLPAPTMRVDYTRQLCEGMLGFNPEIASLVDTARYQELLGLNVPATTLVPGVLHARRRRPAALPSRADKRPSVRPTPQPEPPGEPS